MRIKLRITTKNNEQDKKIHDISEIMETFGKYQIIQYILICTATIFIAMISLNYVFVVGDIGYRCRVDECEDANSTAQFPKWWPDTNIDRCFKPVLKTGETDCTNNSFTRELTACDRWIYESNNTVVAELDLACQPWSRSLVGTIRWIGMMVSVILSGWMSDKFGRKPIFLFSAVAGCIGNIKTFATSYYVYVIIEFLEALVSGGCSTIAVVLLLEIVGIRYRLLSGVIVSFVIYTGETLYACVATFITYWKFIIYIINGPCIIFIIYVFLINESPRWQIVTGRFTNAKITIKRIAYINKLHINEEELTNIDEDTLREKFNIKRDELKEGYMDIFKSKEIIKRIFVATVLTFSGTFVYYGMMINSVWLPGDKYQNFILTSVMSFPGELICLLIMNIVGRKIPLMIGYSIIGVMCILTAFIPENYIWTKLTLFLIGKVIISACVTGAVTYTVELFPTSIRGSLLGLAAFSARLGGILAPLTPIMNTFSEKLPLLLFSFCAMLTSGLLILMPETKDVPLFDTIKQVESYSNNRAP